ncbi:MAG: Hsp20/alpha crystallin family protein [Legionellaceae bacterium]|nr:Hsp20/alpha crystallin family protein [Legionellaceae bacterium]
MSNSNKARKPKLDLIEEHEFNPLLTLQQDLNTTMTHFYDLFEPGHYNADHFENIKLSPAMDLVECKHEFRIEVEMPGLDESNIKVSIDNNNLTVIGEKSFSKRDRSKTFIDREIKYGRYERNISLPQTADLEKVTASFNKGMLWITIPKKDNKKCCRRDVKIRRGNEK